MSSFKTPHSIYLFNMKNGKKKVGYGASEQEAFDNFALRLSAEEMDMIIRENPKKINQREYRAHVEEFG